MRKARQSKVTEMKKHQKLLTVSRVVELERRLSQIAEVARFDMPGEAQGHTLAHALSHWEDSFTAFLDDLLPKLANKTATDEELIDAIHDVGDELRHILYHIKDVKYFAYLLADSEDNGE
jgi:hypothetical protein